MWKRNLTSSGCGLALLLAAMPAQGAVIFSDDFESYLNTAQLIAPGAWGDNNAANIALSTTLNAAGNPGQALNTQRASNATALISAQHTIPNSTPSNTAPLIWSFDFFDDGVGNKRVTGGLRNTSASALLEMGRFNSVANVENANALVSGYAVRAVNVGGTPAGNSGWVTFVGNPAIQAGWHTFTATILADYILFELDFGANGTVNASRIINTSTGGSEIYNVLRLGGPSDVSSAGGGASFDNVLLATFETTKGVFSTGVGSFSTVVDQHWTVQRVAAADSPVSAGPGAPTFIVPSDGFPIPPWIANDADSQWISSAPNNDGNDLPGFYDYSIDFDLLTPGFLIEGEWAADNRGVDIFLNGVATGQTTAGFGALSDFILAEGFQVGLNRLTFRVQNDGTALNPTGLRVNITNAQVIIPEPGTLSLGVLGAMALMARRRRATAC